VSSGPYLSKCLCLHLLPKGVKLIPSINISTHDPWIMLNEQHIIACISTKLMIVLGCKIPHKLDALKWKDIGRAHLLPNLLICSYFILPGFFLGDSFFYLYFTGLLFQKLVSAPFYLINLNIFAINKISETGIILLFFLALLHDTFVLHRLCTV
jgi:hypothetical protein